MPRTRPIRNERLIATTETQSVELTEHDIKEMFKDRIVSLHLKNKFFEFATKSGELFNCPICFADLKQPEAFMLLVCGHHTCGSCYHYSPERRCPVCRS